MQRDKVTPLATCSPHLCASVHQGLEIVEALRRRTTGYGVPACVIDAPGGGGKTPVSPEWVLSWNPDQIDSHDYQGRLFEYSEAPRALKEPELV